MARGSWECSFDGCGVGSSDSSLPYLGSEWRELPFASGKETCFITEEELKLAGSSTVGFFRDDQ